MTVAKSARIGTDTASRAVSWNTNSTSDQQQPSCGPFDQGDEVERCRTEVFVGAIQIFQRQEGRGTAAFVTVPRGNAQRNGPEWDQGPHKLRGPAAAAGQGKGRPGTNPSDGVRGPPYHARELGGPLLVGAFGFARKG